MANKSTTKKPATTKATEKKVKKVRDFTNARKWLRDAYYAVWTVVGLLIIGAAAYAYISNTSFLNVVQRPPAQTEQTAAPQPQASQPTQQQLDCISKEVGQERFDQLNQGQAADQDEAVIIQNCLAQ
jgi:type VI protein secretion system component VasK